MDIYQLEYNNIVHISNIVLINKIHNLSLANLKFPNNIMKTKLN